MPIRFSTEAANADKMRTDADSAEAPPDAPHGPAESRFMHERGKAREGEAGKGLDGAGTSRDEDRRDPDAV